MNAGRLEVITEFGSGGSERGVVETFIILAKALKLAHSHSSQLNVANDLILGSLR